MYGTIILLSIVAGIIVACVLMRRAGASNTTVLYTAVFTTMCIFVVSFMMSVALSGDIRKAGFVGAGGALGLIIGAVTSALIHNDHAADSIAAWIVASPLMYGLSKIACHIAGCCNGIPYTGPLCVTYASRGGASFFPVQLLETIVFLIIFAAAFIMYLKCANKMKAAMITVSVSAIAKALCEFLRESHMGKIISGYQLIVLGIAAAFVITSVILGKRLKI